MSNNLQRKLNRKKFLEDKKEAEKEIANKIRGIFLPDQCSVCSREFDKKSREMAQTWRVVAKEEQKRLICPDCWELIEKSISQVEDPVE